jgi:predicted DNA-binding WGR domain protein
MNYYLTSINTDKNRYRFYEITLQHGLFYKYFVIRKWGRIGTKGRKIEMPFDTMEEVEKEIQRLLKIRKRHGYSVKV